MWYEFFLFEINYRLKRRETYAYFFILLLFSIVGVEFVFQGIDLGPVKKNAPIVIAKTMAAITAFFMLMISMVMGVPILRDVQYNTTPLLYVNPITKKDYLLGHFLGSLVVLLFICSGLLFGMILGEFMPWVNPEEYLSFRWINYVQPFIWVALPIMLFGAALFFVTGALSKKLMVVYTQGIFVFVLFMLTKSVSNEELQAILDPFSLTTLSKATEHWTNTQRNVSLIPFGGVLFFNKLFWGSLGMAAMAFGYFKFQFEEKARSGSKKTQKIEVAEVMTTIPITSPSYNFRSQLIQLLYSTWFHAKSLLKETSFWAIVSCSFIIIIINSISLGTTFDVDSYPTSYLIIEELQEMSIYFFMIILLFYSGEIIWKERAANLNLIYDATPANNFIHISSKYLSLLLIYSVLIFALIIAGIIFQATNSYYHFDLKVYFISFFLDLFPTLALFTIIAFFCQALTGRKFMGILITILIFIAILAVRIFGIEHILLNFAGHALPPYSEINGYGHYLKPFLLVKSYWFLFGLMLLILSSILLIRGTENSLIKRWKTGFQQAGKSLLFLGSISLLLFIGVGGFIFYNTNVLNQFWSKNKQEQFRANYEKIVKPITQIEQPKIVDTQLKVDLYPSKQQYEIAGQYRLINPTETPITEIHVQKIIKTNVQLFDIQFSQATKTNHQYQTFDYTIYTLEQPFLMGDTLNMNFKQHAKPQGFEANDFDIDIVHNGTFFDNTILPSFGYQRKYELEDKAKRASFNLAPRIPKASRDDKSALANARSGSDSEGTTLEIIISTEAPQTAVTSGKLINQWTNNNRNYFHYKSEKPIINFYALLSADYKILKDTCIPKGNIVEAPVDIEIYYQEGHEHNLDRMMEATKMSLDYYSLHFSPYQYEQIRILEFPRYRAFAQSFPNAIPFSEAMGFMMDIDDVEDVDMVFFITAHEVAHQWWGMQLEAANVQGQDMILETLSQYSALMVFKEKYPETKVNQFLQLQLDRYKEGLKRVKKSEIPLSLVANEEYLYYAKGVINMYHLQKHIGEQNVNISLQNFLTSWKSFDNPTRGRKYATTKELIWHFRALTPGSLQYLVPDLFERVNPIDSILRTE